MLCVKTSWCSVQAEELPCHLLVSSPTGSTAATLLSKPKSSASTESCLGVLCPLILKCGWASSFYSQK